MLLHTSLMLLFTSVDLRSNSLSSLPTLQHLRCVHTLLLDDNRLQGLPPQTNQLASLKVLSLKNNRIHTH